MSRTTIADIARECGVSPTAVSFALNGRPGVSESRREQILAKADALGWTPSVAARALSTSRVGAIGLLLAMPVDAVSRDAFYMRFVAGIEKELAGSPDALVLKIVDSVDDEVEALRRWHGEHRVDGVILVNPRPDDPRLALADELELPTVFSGDLRDHPGASFVMIDDARTMSALLTDLVGLGFTDVAYIHASTPYRHAHERLRALEESAAVGVERHRPLAIDESDDERAAAQVEAHADALVREGLPEVIVCEDEWITLAVLGALSRRGVEVPDDVALASWESTMGLTMRAPAISTVERDPGQLGQSAARVLRNRIAGARPPLQEIIEPPRLVVRDSLIVPGRAARTTATA